MNITQPCRPHADDAEDDRRGFRYHRYTHDVVDREVGRGVHSELADVGRGEVKLQAFRPTQGDQAHRGPVAHKLERAAPVVGEVERDVADLGAGAVRTRVAQNVEAEEVA